MVHVVGVIDGFALLADNLRGHADSSAVGRDFPQHDRAARDTGVIAHAERSKYFRPATYEHVVAQGRMTLASVLARTAERHALIYQAVVADFGRLPDNDAHAVVNDEAAPDNGAGVDFDTRPEAGPLRHATRQKAQVVAVQPMGETVP